MTESAKRGNEELEPGYYYRTIARHFWLHAGARFLLSARDLQVIAKWESQEIPLPVILEGIEACLKRKKPQPGFRRGSLAACDREVQKAFAQFRDRRVGQSQPLTRVDKKKKVLQAVEEFLNDFPPALLRLQPVFSRARSLLEQGETEIIALELEALEAAVEIGLAELATEEEKKAVRTSLEEELRSLGVRPDEEIMKTALLKYLRQKYRVPHLLTCYY